MHKHHLPAPPPPPPPPHHPNSKAACNARRVGTVAQSKACLPTSLFRLHTPLFTISLTEKVIDAVSECTVLMQQ